MNANGTRLPLPAGFERIVTEMETYYRELPRLLEEGHAGKIALVQGAEVSIWDTTDDALQYAAEKYGLRPTIAQPIDERDLDRLAPYMPHPEGAVP
jgi:hypothetical protein